MYRIPALRLFNILVNRRSAAHEFIGNSFRTRARRVFETTHLPTARGTRRVDSPIRQRLTYTSSFLFLDLHPPFRRFV